MPRVLAAAKRLLLPRGRRPRTIARGIARGVRMELDFAHETRLYLGLYELELERDLRALARPGTACLDIGAQSGYLTLALARLTRAPVVAFDSDPAAEQVIARNLALNPALAPLVRTVIGEVGELPGQVRLDDWVFSAGGLLPGLVKIDIEGGEAAALRSAPRLLEHGPALVVEVHARELERDCLELLRAAGYAPRIVDQRRLLADRRPIEHNRWIVALRP